MSTDSQYSAAPAAAPPIEPTFSNNLIVMGRVIFALMIRESRTRYGKTDLGYLWAIIDPTIQLGVFWLLFTILGRVVPVPASMPVFLITGMLPYRFWFACVGRGASAAPSNLPLLTYPQVKVFDVVLARVLLDATTFIIVTLMFVIGLRFLAGEPFTSWVRDPIVLATAVLALFYFSVCSAIFSSSLARIFPVWPEVFGYMGRPLYFASGIFFTFESLPTGFRGLALYLPTAHMLEWIRTGAIPGFVSTLYSPLFILSFSTIILVIGMMINWTLTLIGHADESH
jgi:capsular polysaccharide transport system permease protein